MAGSFRASRRRRAARPFSQTPVKRLTWGGQSNCKRPIIWALTRVEKLPGLQIAARIADDRGLGSRKRVSAQIIGRLQLDWPAHVKRFTGVWLNGRAALRLRDAREDPAIDHPSHEFVVFHGAGQIDYVGCVEDVGVVPRQHAVVCVQAERIYDGACLRAIGAVPIADAEDLAERVIRGKGHASRLLLPRRNKRVVVRVTAVGFQENTRIVVERIVILSREAASPGGRRAREIVLAGYRIGSVEGALRD